LKSLVSDESRAAYRLMNIDILCHAVESKKRIHRVRHWETIADISAKPVGSLGCAAGEWVARSYGLGGRSAWVESGFVVWEATWKPHHSLFGNQKRLWRHHE